jgi:galactose mutarotase-like enzyme
MDLIELRSGASIASISPEGGECLRWHCAGREMLWKADAAVWDRIAPLLFPVCGWTCDGIRVAGTSYPLGLHGFASSERFVVGARDADHVTLRVCDNPTSRALYPFPFLLEVSYRLSADALEVAAVITNRGDGVMPYAFGLHPGFRLLGEAESCRLVFDKAERAEVPVIAPGGLFSQEQRLVPLEGRLLQLGGDLFAREALCFLDARSAGLVFEGPEGQLRIETQGFPHWVLWSRPGAPFLCLESWTGFGDPVGFSGELVAKPGMILLAPGASRRHLARYVFTG